MHSRTADPTGNESIRPPLWRELVRVFLGGQCDYTSEPVRRGLVLLAVPMVLEMLMESLFAITNVFWVARLGRDAIAAVGLTESAMTVIYAIAMGISIAAAAAVARRTGESNPERAARTAGQILTLGLVTSIVLGLGFGWFAEDVLAFMGASTAVVEAGSGYTRLMLGGNVTVFMLFLINAIFRGAGDPALAMRTLWLANLLNIGLAPCFIFGWGPFPEMGVAGAAIATNIGRGIGVVYQIWHLAGGAGRVRVRLRDLQPSTDVLGRLVRTSLSGIGQQLLITTSWIALFKILATFGSAAVAGYTIAIRIVLFATLPVMGLANAGATLVGQNLGAQRPERAEEAIRTAVTISLILLTIVGALFVALSHPLVHVFTSDPEVLAEGTRALRIVSLAFPLYGAAICLGAAFNGAGDTRTPTRLNFFCFWLGQIPLAWILSHSLDLGSLGVFIAVPISFSALAVCGGVLFQRARWKLTKV